MRIDSSSAQPTSAVNTEGRAVNRQGSQETAQTMQSPKQLQQSGKTQQEQMRKEQDRPNQLEDIQDAVDEANRAFEPLNRYFEYEKHDKINRTMVRVFDSRTDELIREIPPEKLVDLVANILDVAGLLVDERA